MNNKDSWQQPLDDFLSKSDISADTRVLARALSENSDLSGEKLSEQDIAEMEKALHIEQHLDEIGLQAMPSELSNKLQNISNVKQSNNVIFGYFTPSWNKLAALAATVTAVALFNTNMLNSSEVQQPTLAEIQHAQQELAIALSYVSLAKNKSAQHIKQTFNDNIQQPLNQGLLKPLNHFKETS